MSHTGIYQNGVSAQSFACEVTVNGNAIDICVTADNNKLVFWNIGTIKSCQGNETSLLVTHGNFPHETLECSGEVAKTIFETWSKNSIGRKTEGFFFTKNKYRVLWLCLTFFALGLFGYFYILPWAGEQVAGMIPQSVEENLGNQLKDQFDTQYTSLDSASYYTQQFVNELNVGSAYKIDVQVVESDEINAFALPGGKIFVFSGIIDQMSTPEELVALLGHEVTHVNNRHSLKNICRALAGSYVIAAMFGDATGISSGILMQADQFKQLDYSRNLESEADREGLALMIKNKVDPKGMKDLLELLKEEGAKMPHLMKYLSTHPETEERIQMVAENPNSKYTFATNPKLLTLFQNIKRNIANY